MALSEEPNRPTGSLVTDDEFAEEQAGKLRKSPAGRRRSPARLRHAQPTGVGVVKATKGLYGALWGFQPTNPKNRTKERLTLTIATSSSNLKAGPSM